MSKYFIKQTDLKKRKKEENESKKQTMLNNY